MEEKWKDIVGYEGLYQISDYGRIKALEKKSKVWFNGYQILKERELRPYSSGNGYFKIALTKDGVTKKYFVHRLVANAFLPNPKGLPLVNHIDKNRENNRVENLEWCTYRENLYHGIKYEESGFDYKNIYILQYDIDGNFVKIWRSYNEISDEMGFSVPEIRACCRGELKTAYGYLWRMQTGDVSELNISKIEGVKNPRLRRPVLQMTMDGVSVGRYKDIMSAHKATGISRTSITNAVKRKESVAGDPRKVAGGYLWKYEDER